MPRILIIEDEELLRNLYKELLEMKGYKVSTASDGREGLEYLNVSGADLVLLDINMPGLGGLEFLEIIKKEDKLKKIPILLITGTVQVEKISKCLTMGAVGYIEKASSPVEIMSKIDLILGAFVDVPGSYPPKSQRKERALGG